jgi:hypothetical protein
MTMSHRYRTGTQVLLAGLLASSIASGAAAPAAMPARSAATGSGHTANAASAATSAHRGPSMASSRGEAYYRSAWGVDNLSVRTTSSGILIRFSYRVLDPDKAKPLNDKQTAPFLIDEKSETMLQVPEMEQVGQLRQTAKAEAGREYWMVFSNRGRFVKSGDRVDVNIGPFRANGLVVE